MEVDTSHILRNSVLNQKGVIIRQDDAHIIQITGLKVYQPFSFMGLYLPGVEKRPLTAGYSYLLPAHSDISIQVHYACHGDTAMPGGFELQFWSRADNAKNTIVKTMVVGESYINKPLFIAAGKKENFLIKHPPLSKTVWLHKLYPHMHQRGVYFESYAVNAATADTIRLVRINRWNYRWQGNYVLPTALKIDAGYCFVVKGEFDNTAANPNNPFLPPRDAEEGMNTSDEMLQMFMEYSE